MHDLQSVVDRQRSEGKVMMDMVNKLEEEKEQLIRRNNEIKVNVMKE